MTIWNMKTEKWKHGTRTMKNGTTNHENMENETMTHGNGKLKMKTWKWKHGKWKHEKSHMKRKTWKQGTWKYENMKLEQRKHGTWKTNENEALKK